MNSPDEGSNCRQELEFFSADIARTIRFARLRCLSRCEVIERVLDTDALGYEDLDAYVFRLTELDLTPAELELIAKGMDNIARKTEKASPEVMRFVEKALLRLLRFLPPRLANKFGLPYLSHRRKGRRRWAYLALRGKQISRGAAKRLANVFRSTGDKSILGLLTKNPECVRVLGARFLLGKLKNKDEAHWRGRVIECLLTYDRSEAVRLANEFPWEFVYAAGRTGDGTLLQAVQTTFRSTPKNRDIVSIYAWCLGKIGARDELEVLEAFLQKSPKATV